MAKVEKLMEEILRELKDVNSQLQELNAIRNGDYCAPMSRSEWDRHMSRPAPKFEAKELKTSRDW